MATKEFYTNSFQRFIDYRNRSLRKSRYLGPLDVCIVLRRSSGSYLSFLSSPAHQTYLHWFLGADTSSVAAICAYFQRLQSLDSGAYAKAGPEIVGATIGVYNAFAGMDLRIQINLDAKPAVSVYAVDESLRRHDRVTEDMLDGAFVCSCLRRIAMPPSLVPSLHVEDDWVPKGVEKLFIKAVERLLEAGAIIKGFENADVIQRQQAVTVLQLVLHSNWKIWVDISFNVTSGANRASFCIHPLPESWNQVLQAPPNVQSDPGDLCGQPPQTERVVEKGKKRLGSRMMV
eukprot:1395414-Amorphochlora_amoeboformis.AAC.1